MVCREFYVQVLIGTKCLPLNMYVCTHSYNMDINDIGGYDHYTLLHSSLLHSKT